jgi:hypothetical protein
MLGTVATMLSASTKISDFLRGCDHLTEFVAHGVEERECAESGFVLVIIIMLLSS